MNMYTTMLEKHRIAYSNFSVLYNALNDFSLDENEETTKNLKVIAGMSKGGMPLPSSRYGNSLAVALEMQLYKGALFMIKNADDLEIDLESISSEYGMKNVWSAQQTFEFSQLGFEMTKIADDDQLYKDYPWSVQFNNSNIDAALEISTILQGKTKGNNK